jgi:hypothetical protein
MRAALPLCLLTLAACGRGNVYNLEPICTAQPSRAQLKVRFTNENALLWELGTCIPVTYAPTLEPIKADIVAALAEWASQPCAALCFAELKVRGDAPTEDNDFRLHFAGASNTGAWELVSDRNTGRTLHATVWANTTATRGDLLKQLGQVLGFEATTQARDSVIEETTVPSPRTTLGSLDRQSVCAAYPSCR